MNKQILHSKIYENKNKPSLLIFHGLFGLLDNWGSLGKKFGENYDTHLIDLRNHGKSFHSDEMSYESMVEDIADYIDFYNLNKPILLGHSLGGRAVMSFSIEKPDLVHKLIVVDMAPKAYKPHHVKIFEALNTIDFSNVRDRKDVENMLSKEIDNKAIVQFLVKNVYRKDDNSFDFRFNLKGLEKNYIHIISKAIETGIFLGSSLFISGEKSNYILEDDKIEIIKQFPNSKFISISNAGHWVQAENPNDFYNSVVSFIES